MPFRKAPIRTRRHIQNHGDPYLDDLRPDEMAMCRECRAVYHNGRWQFEDRSSSVSKMQGRLVETLCAACQKIRDRMPSGVLTLSGRFLDEHEEEISNLVRREEQKAMAINPLSRIMAMERTAEGLLIETTNEKLAQRLGRAVNKAYGGEVEYKWSEDTKLARVNWHRG